MLLITSNKNYHPGKYLYNELLKILPTLLRWEPMLRVSRITIEGTEETFKNKYDRLYCYSNLYKNNYFNHLYNSNCLSLSATGNNYYN